MAKRKKQATAKSNAKKTSQSSAKISESTCKTRAKEWQQTKVSNLGELFYAFDDSDQGQFSQTSQRVLAFKLDPTDVPKLFNSKSYKSGSSELRIYMGSDKKSTVTIPNTPGFAPFIQCYNGAPDGYKDCFKLTWDPQPPFSTGGLDSGAIPLTPVSRSAAELFVTSWCKQSFESLPSLFESAINDSYVARVQSFTFPSTDVDMIYQTLMDGNSGFDTLYVLLGVELTSTEFPFGFRPVIQTKESSSIELELPDGTILTLPTFFEFSKPCPPFCGTGGGGF